MNYRRILRFSQSNYLLERETRAGRRSDRGCDTGRDPTGARRLRLPGDQPRCTPLNRCAVPSTVSWWGHPGRSAVRRPPPGPGWRSTRQNSIWTSSWRMGSSTSSTAVLQDVGARGRCDLRSSTNARRVEVSVSVPEQVLNGTSGSAGFSPKPSLTRSEQTFPSPKSCGEPCTRKGAHSGGPCSRVSDRRGVRQTLDAQRFGRWRTAATESLS